jgi:hypothetical protein
VAKYSSNSLVLWHPGACCFVLQILPLDTCLASWAG